MKIKYVVVKNEAEFKDYIRENSPPNVASHKFVDNELVDLSECWTENPELHKYPTFCSQAVWQLIDDAANNPDDRDDHMDIIWDVLWMNYQYEAEVLGDGSLFPVEIDGKRHVLITVPNKYSIDGQSVEVTACCIMTLGEISNGEFIDINELFGG